MKTNSRIVLRRLKRCVGGSHNNIPYPHPPSQLDLMKVGQMGLTLRAKLVGITEVGPKERVPDFLSRQFRREVRLKKSIKVFVTVAATRVHIGRKNPWELLYDSPMDRIVLFNTKSHSPRIFYYVSSNPETGRDTIVYLKTRKRDKETRNAERMYDAVEYASSLWARKKVPEHPKVAALRRKHALLTLGESTVDTTTEQEVVEVPQETFRPERSCTGASSKMESQYFLDSLSLSGLSCASI